MFSIRPYRKGDCLGFKIRADHETGTDTELDERFEEYGGTSIISQDNRCIGAISYFISADYEVYVFCAFRDTPTRELILFVKEMLRIAATTSPLNFYCYGVDSEKEEKFLSWLGFEKTAIKEENAYKYKYTRG